MVLIIVLDRHKYTFHKFSRKTLIIRDNTSIFIHFCKIFANRSYLFSNIYKINKIHRYYPYGSKVVEKIIKLNGYD